MHKTEILSFHNVGVVKNRYNSKKINKVQLTPTKTHEDQNQKNSKKNQRHQEPKLEWKDKGLLLP